MEVGVRTAVDDTISGAAPGAPGTGGTGGVFQSRVSFEAVLKNSPGRALGGSGGSWESFGRVWEALGHTHGEKGTHFW